MPELPEVETLRRGLERSLVGKTIVHVRIGVSKMLRGTVTDPQAFQECLQGQRIESISRRGKHLIFMLDSGYYLLLHLKMRGQLVVVPRETPDDKYFAAALEITGGQEMRFYDMWTWGELRLTTAQELASHPALSKMGPEPNSEQWTPQQFAEMLACRPRSMIKAVLLDQSVVAGVGNIYADESLFRSGIQPTRPAGTLTESEIARLHRTIQQVLTEATDGGGTTSDNYVDLAGDAGRYVPQVYDRAGQGCPQCGETLVRLKVTGRGTTFCPHCQA